MRTIIKLAWRNIWRNKRRTFITIASVFFAVILSTMMDSMKQGMYVNMIKTSVGDFFGYIQIQNTEYADDKIIDNALELTDEVTASLKANENVKDYLPRIESFALAASEEITKGTMVVGADVLKEIEFNNLDERLTKGEFLNPDDKSILIGEGLADFLKVGVNDTVVLLGSGYHGSSAAGKYPIKGIIAFGSPDLSKRLVMLPIKEAQWLFGLENQFTSLNIQLKDNKKFKKTATELNASLGKEYKAKNWEELLPELRKMIDTDEKEGYVFMFILYLVVSFGIFGTSLMMLAERRHEFGVMISLGMKKIMLAVTVWIEMIALSLLGAIFGMLGAFPICLYYNINPIKLGGDMTTMMEEYGMEAVLQFSIDPSVFTKQAMVVFLLASIISIYAFLKILNFNPIKEMKD